LNTSNEGNDHMTTTITAHEPRLETYELKTRDGGVMRLHAQRLGHGSSDDGQRPRWFVVDIFRTSDGVYVVYTQGMSQIEGETTFVRIVQTSSAFEIIELLTVYHNGKTYLPRQSARAIAQAAQWDDNVRDAYVNRAVT
jgi:hypothetical protein